MHGLAFTPPFHLPIAQAWHVCAAPVSWPEMLHARHTRTQSSAARHKECAGHTPCQKRVTPVSKQARETPAMMHAKTCATRSGVPGAGRAAQRKARVAVERARRHCAPTGTSRKQKRRRPEEARRGELGQCVGEQMAEKRRGKRQNRSVANSRSRGAVTSSASRSRTRQLTRDDGRAAVAEGAVSGRRGQRRTGHT